MNCWDKTDELEVSNADNLVRQFWPRTICKDEWVILWNTRSVAYYRVIHGVYESVCLLEGNLLTHVRIVFYQCSNEMEWLWALELAILFAFSEEVIKILTSFWCQSFHFECESFFKVITLDSLAILWKDWILEKCSCSDTFTYKLLDSRQIFFLAAILFETFQ